MDIIEYQKAIVESEAEDWHVIHCHGTGGPSYLVDFESIHFGNRRELDINIHNYRGALKSNLSIGIAWGMTDNDNWKEPWANNFPDPKASSHFIDFFYNGMLVFRDRYISVDGARCSIPLPEVIHYNKAPSVYLVPKTKLHFVAMLEELMGGRDFNDFFKRTGIEVEESGWMY